MAWACTSSSSSSSSFEFFKLVKFSPQLQVIFTNKKYKTFLLLLLGLCVLCVYKYKPTSGARC
jgi:hypothetical protein